MENAEKTGGVLLCAALAFCAALAAHAPALSGTLLWDDTAFIGSNAFVSDCSNLRTVLNPVNLIKILPVPMSARPLVNASLLADACSGAGPGGMRLTNLLLHAFNAALLFALLFLLSGSAPAALFGAVVFAVHPAAAEAVNIITFRAHLLGFFFFISGLLCALFYGRGAGRPAAAASAACYFLALMSAETALVLPAAALLAVYFDTGRGGLKRTLPLLGVMAAVALFYLWFRVPRSGYAIAGVSAPGIAGASAFYPRVLLPETSGGRAFALTLTPWRAVYADPAANLYTMTRVTLDYLGALVLPLRLSPDYSPEVITTLKRGLPPVLGVVGVLVSGIYFFSRKRLSGLGLLIIFTGLLPALNIWPIYNLKADRYLYLPLAGFSLAAAAGLRYVLAGSGRRVLLVPALAWLALLGGLTLRRAPEFRDDLALFSAAVRRQPAAPRARVNLSAAYLRLGDCAGAGREAAAAAGLDAANPQLRLRLAFTLAYCGSKEQALKETLTALAAVPGEADALYLAGLLKLKTDRAQALALLRRAAAAAPDRREALLTLYMAEKKKPAALGPRDRRDLADLKDFYRRAGLLF